MTIENEQPCEPCHCTACEEERAGMADVIPHAESTQSWFECPRCHKNLADAIRVLEEPELVLYIHRVSHMRSDLAIMYGIIAGLIEARKCPEPLRHPHPLDEQLDRAEKLMAELKSYYTE
jgi:hypothetical protein